MVTPGFVIAAAAMVVAAVACVLVPMLRSARREGRPRAPFVLALVLALAMPPVVAGAYLAVGTPQALEAPSLQGGNIDLATATRQLESSLARRPDDATGWALLARAYAALGKRQQALGALNHLVQLEPNDPDVLVAWVEARAEASETHLIDDTSRTRLHHALEIDPTHQRALWLLGISDFQRQHYADAARQWKTLLPLLAPGSKVEASVREELAEAEARAADKPTAASPDNHKPAADIALKVRVQLDPKLAGEVRPGDTVFVFARAVDGPSMPLAVARLKASALPTDVTLTDAMAMAPQHKLSDFAKVQIAARLSKSGDATPQPGDLESAAVEVATTTPGPVALMINKVE